MSFRLGEGPRVERRIFVDRTAQMPDAALQSRGSISSGFGLRQTPDQVASPNGG